MTHTKEEAIRLAKQAATQGELLGNRLANDPYGVRQAGEAAYTAAKKAAEAAKAANQNGN